MINECTFRKLNINDLDKVLKMEDDFREGLVKFENARLFLSNNMNWLIACIYENRIIGFAYGYEMNRLNSKGNMVYIHEIAVLSEFQKKGIGTELVKTIKIICRLSGICRFFLFTERSNIGACKLYIAEKGEEAHIDDVTFFFNDLN
ncbi:MAG: GNAT family N-acetyltransferase [Spirochaetes bacterium]|nr:GNAT family N-acetyltransferase [Spirochaetota bacterium]